MSHEITVIEQRDIDFYGDDLTAIKATDGHVYVSVRHMCNALGIDTNGQVQRIGRHTVLTDGRGTCKLHDPHGVVQTFVILRVDLVPLWLSGIRTKSVNEAIRPKLERFQKEAGRILWEAFQTGELSIDDNFSDLLKQDTPSVQAYKLALAVAKMARQQVVLESRINRQDEAIASHAATLGDLSERVESIEADLGQGERFISNSQAMHISQAVKTVALELGKRSGRNEFSGVYGELYRRFRIPSYRELPATEYDPAMNFLRDWYGSLVDVEVPF